jgi:tricorn protease-like protein
LVCLYEQGEFKHAFKAPVKKGVIAVAISPNGKFAACVGMDDKHSMAVLDLESQTVVKLDETTNKLITKIKWRDNKEIITVGINFYG